jgi:tRNA(fMet)-specific endonuclease VapC
MPSRTRQGPLPIGNSEEIGLSVIALHELYYGAFKSKRRERNPGLVDGLQFEVVRFDREDSRRAGEIRAELAKRGLPIGPYDVLIAAQARARDLSLVTETEAARDRAEQRFPERLQRFLQV